MLIYTSMVSRTTAAALPLFDAEPTPHPDMPFEQVVERFACAGAPTAMARLSVPLGADDGVSVPVFTNEFWTARQRAAHSLHEVSYRACFKPQLPRFFIERLSAPGDVVYDPFMGRGTTLVEAALLERAAYGCDVNPLSRVLCEPRLHPPSLAEIHAALGAVDFTDAGELPEDLLVFYHPRTLGQICALRRHLLDRERAGTLTRAERWIRMVAVNRLTGHSPGFFSVYTLPPNQAVSPRAQAKINASRKQTPEPRDVKAIILRKSRALLADVSAYVRATLDRLAPYHRLVTGQASAVVDLPDGSAALAVTSPPFLDVVQYKTDNWLRCWFIGIDSATVPVTMARRVEAWQEFVRHTLSDVRRVLRPGGHIAFEVGEVRGGAVRLEEVVIPAGVAAGLDPVLVLINAQAFTKTANCWGVANNRKGTNSNRVVLLRKSAV